MMIYMLTTALNVVTEAKKSQLITNTSLCSPT